MLATLFDDTPSPPQTQTPVVLHALTAAVSKSPELDPLPDLHLNDSVEGIFSPVLFSFFLKKKNSTNTKHKRFFYCTS